MKPIELAFIILALTISSAVAADHGKHADRGKAAALTERDIGKLNADMRRAQALVPAQAKKEGLTEEQIEQIKKALAALKKPACLDVGSNSAFWVFAASATEVEFSITVTDTLVDDAIAFDSLGMASPAIVDTAAFATCP